MKRATAILASLTLLVMGVNESRASSIAGPSNFSVVGGNDTLWGIEFTALQNSTLTSFDFNHHPNTGFGQPFTGTISLKDVTASTTPYSTSYGTDTATVIPFSGLNVSLISGHVYDLVATSSILFGANDEVYEYTSYPVSNADISVTKGIFDNNPGFQEGAAWGAFNNITTSSAAVPEPSSMALVGLGLAGLAAYARRTRNRVGA